MTQGIHHITAIASDAAACMRFFSEILGLRLVKKTVNQDDTRTYHLFFGDRLGHPGMDLTFFLFRPPMSGTTGNGLVTKISLAVPEASLGFWDKRFEEWHVKHSEITSRFGKNRLPFVDADGMKYELVGVGDEEMKDADVWESKGIEAKHAISSFYSASMRVPDITLIEPVLTDVFGYTKISEFGDVNQYALPGAQRAAVLEVETDPLAMWGLMGAGTVHHIAFRARDGAH